MSSLIALIGILTALLLAAISPGPSFLLVSRIAVSQSRLHGFAAALGMGLGGFIFASLALFGLATLLHQLPGIYFALKLAGGAYLIWLGIKIWRYAKESLPSVSATKAQKQSLLRSFSFAFLTQISNPKTGVFYASIFVPMLPDSPPAWFFAVLPLLCFALEAGWYSIVALVFSAAHPRHVYLRFKIWIDRLAGTMMGLLGLRLILDAAGIRR